MCEWKWIEKKKSEDAANVTIYQLLEKGRKIAETIKELEKNSEDFLKLDSFHGVKLQ